MSTIIFDFDGTIADSFKVVLDIFYELTGKEPYDEEQISKFKAMSMRKAVKAAHLPPRQIPRLLIKGRTQMSQRLNELKPFPDIKQVLKKLHDNGHNLLVISSNSQSNVRSFLKEHKLDAYFDGVYGGIGLLSKASALRRVLRINKLAAQDCYYVGDEIRDIHAAKRAHIRSIAVTWGYNDGAILAARKPFMTADSPKDLLHLS